MEIKDKEIILKGVKVVFADLEDKGFGRNIVIDASDKAVEETICNWVKINNINGGVAKFKDYTNKDGEATKQYTFKLSNYTQFDGVNNLNEKSIGFGAIINLIAQAYEYNNKFGKGISASLEAVYVKEGATQSSIAKISD